MYEKLAKAKGFSIFMAIVCYLGGKFAIMLCENFRGTSIAVPAFLQAPMSLFGCLDWHEIPASSGSSFLMISNETPLAVLAIALVVAAIIFAVIAYIAHTIENDN